MLKLMTFSLLSLFQLAELEHRVVEAESRAEDAEDKVSQFIYQRFYNLKLCPYVITSERAIVRKKGAMEIKFRGPEMEMGPSGLARRAIKLIPTAANIPTVNGERNESGVGVGRSSSQICQSDGRKYTDAFFLGGYAVLARRSFFLFPRARA